MKKNLMLLAVGLAFTLGSVAAETVSTSRRALAEELLNVMKIREQIEKSSVMIRKMMPAQTEKMMQTMGPTNAVSNAAMSNMATHQDKVMEMVTQEMSWDKIKEDYITLYAETFTEEEMQGLIAFYKTPAGVAMLVKQPELMQRTMEMSQKMMLRIAPKIQEMTQEMMKNMKPVKPDEQISASPSSAEILAKADGIYGNLDSYQDEGVALTKFEGTLLDQTTELHFTTAYSRAGNFRFEFWKSNEGRSETRYVVWKNGKEVKSWWTIEPTVKVRESLGDAISGATGVSGGTAYNIPSVLMKEAAWKGCTWTSPAGTYRIRDSTEGGTACFRIQRLTSTSAEKVDDTQMPATKGKKTYWITKDGFLLVRIDEETNFEKFSTRETVKYSPKINAPIPNSAFVFGH